jgi:hypothetical protein
MRNIRLLKDNKYFKTEMEYNEQFGVILEIAIKLLKTKTLKSIALGTNYQYVTYKGPVNVYWSKRVRHNNKSLVFKGENFELESNPSAWEEIEFKDKEILIDDVGLYFTFDKSIRKHFEGLFDSEKECMK